MADEETAAIDFLRTAASNCWSQSDPVAGGPAGHSRPAGAGSAQRRGPGHRRPASTPDSLRRVLNGLATIGVFSRDADDRFSLTPTSNVMRQDHPRTMAPVIDIALGGEYQQAWGVIEEAVRAGACGFELRHGTGLDRTYGAPPGSAGGLRPDR